MATDIKLRSVVNDNSLKASTTYTPRSTVYVENSNTLGPLEDVMDGTDNTFSINNVTWGSTGVVRIPPSYALVKLCYLHVKLKHTYQANTAQPGHAPDCSYWIYRLLKSFRYRLGNSDVVTESANHMPFLVNDYCDSQEKREMLAEAAGEGFGLYPATQAIDGETIYLNGILPLPWSNPSLWRASKAVPLYMTNQSLEMQFEWEDHANIANLITAGTGSSMEIQYASVKVVYQQLGSYNQLKAAPYLYPFHYHQDNVYNVTLIQDSGRSTRYPAVPAADDLAAKRPLFATFNMYGLRQGETSQFTIRLAPREKVFRSKTIQYSTTRLWLGDGKTTKCNDIYKGVKLSMIQVRFGGQTIYEANVEDSTSILESYYNFLPSTLPGKKRFIRGKSFVESHPEIGYKLNTTTPFTIATVGELGDQFASASTGTSLTSRAADIARRPKSVVGEPFELLGAFRDSVNSDIDFEDRGRGYVFRDKDPGGFYYHIPVASILEHVRGQDYSLGADFDKGEIQCTVWVDTDYYRRKGQYFFMHSTGDPGVVFGSSNVIAQGGTKLAGDNPTNNNAWIGRMDPAAAYHADVIDGATWLANQACNDYAIYALSSTNACYHFSGQNVTRIS